MKPRRTKHHESLLARFGTEAAITAHFREIGRRGGLKGKTGGFYANRELAAVAGKVGGHKSKRHVKTCECGTCALRRSPQNIIPWHKQPFTGNLPYEPVPHVKKAV